VAGLAGTTAAAIAWVSGGSIDEVLVGLEPYVVDKPGGVPNVLPEW